MKFFFFLEKFEFFPYSLRKWENALHLQFNQAVDKHVCCQHFRKDQLCLDLPHSNQKPILVVGSCPSLLPCGTHIFNIIIRYFKVFVDIYFCGRKIFITR